MAIVSAGQPAPPFALSGIDGRSYTLNHSGVRLTLVAFLRTTCPTCTLLFPYLEKLHKDYAPAGLTVWGISQDPRDVSAEFASKLGITFPILLDVDGRVSRAYSPEFIPTVVLIDASGHVVDSMVAFAKVRLNHLVQVAAARLGVPPVMLAPPDDGNPSFRPG